jgi:hypothetical protein
MALRVPLPSPTLVGVFGVFGRVRGSTPTDTPAGRPTCYSAGEHVLRNGYGVCDDGDADRPEPRFRRGSVPVVE